MALNTNKIPNTNSNRVEQPEMEAGVYPARLVQIIDMGLQTQRPYQGKEKPPTYEISMTYELVDSFMVDEDGNELEDKPRWVSETFPIYSLEADMAKSTKRYLALDPNRVHDGDFAALVGTACNVTIVINKKEGKTYTNIANVGAMRPKDVEKCPELVNAPRVFDLDSPDLEVYRAFPKWIQEKIASNLEFKGSKLEELLEGAPPAPEKDKATKPKPARSRKAVVEDEDPAFDPDNADEENPY